MNVGSICLMSEYFHSLFLQGASQLCAKKSQKTRNFRSSEGSCILRLKTELCRVLSSSAWNCGRSSSPFLCILNIMGAYFNVFNQIFVWVFSFSVKHAARGWYMLSKSHAVSYAVWLCIHHDPKIIRVRLQVRMAFPCQKFSLIMMAPADWTECK